MTWNLADQVVSDIFVASPMDAQWRGSALSVRENGAAADLSTEAAEAANSAAEKVRAALESGKLKRADGKDGASVTHSWDGAVLSITSASGTSSADPVGPQGLQGEKGDTGDAGGATSAELATGTGVISDSVFSVECPSASSIMRLALSAISPWPAW